MYIYIYIYVFCLQDLSHGLPFVPVAYWMVAPWALSFLMMVMWRHLHTAWTSSITKQVTFQNSATPYQYHRNLATNIRTSKTL